MQLRNIGRAKCIVCPTNSTVGIKATALPAHCVPARLHIRPISYRPVDYCPVGVGQFTAHKTGSVTITTQSRTDGATTCLVLNSSAYVGHVTIFS